MKSSAEFETAAKLSIAAGFEVIEIHMAPGYLMHEFCLHWLPSQR